MKATPAAWRGISWALVSAFGFGLIPPLARLGYEAGASPMAVVAAQLGIGAAATTLAALIARRSLRLSRASLARTALVAVAWFLASVSYLGSIAYIPVSLAVLILYTFPVVTVLAAPAVDGTRLEPRSIAAAVLALAGLGLALGLDLSSLDLRGIALAAVASLTTAGTFLLSRRVVVDEDVLAFSAVLHVMCAGLTAAWLLAFGAPSLPAEPGGWLALALVCTLYAIAVILQFGAIRLAGAGRASLAFHAEPIVTLLGAAVVVGELLGVRELTGAALVLAAVALASRA